MLGVKVCDGEEEFEVIRDLFIFLLIVLALMTRAMKY